MGELVQIDGADLPLTHNFSDGVYVREIFMPKGMFVVGHVHKTKHLNIVQTGEAMVWMNGEVKKIKAPFTFESDVGVRKVLYILDDMFWSTVHVTEETDLEKLKGELIDLDANENFEVNFDKISQDLIEYIGEDNHETT